MNILINDLINDLYQNVIDQIEYGNKLLNYRKGSIVLKRRNNRNYYYLTYRDGKKVKTDYLGLMDEDKISRIRNELEEGIKLKKEIKKLNKTEKEIRKLINIIDKSCLIKDIYEVIDIIVIIRPILKDYKLKKVYLFGSYANGNADENSDINIYCEDINNIEENLIRKLEKVTNKRVNIVTNNEELPYPMLDDIKNQRILIYGGY